MSNFFTPANSPDPAIWPAYTSLSGSATTTFLAAPTSGQSYHITGVITDVQITIVRASAAGGNIIIPIATNGVTAVTFAHSIVVGADAALAITHAASGECTLFGHTGNAG